MVTGESVRGKTSYIKDSIILIWENLGNVQLIRSDARNLATFAVDSFKLFR